MSASDGSGVTRRDALRAGAVAVTGSAAAGATAGTAAADDDDDYDINPGAGDGPAYDPDRPSVVGMYYGVISGWVGNSDPTADEINLHHQVTSAGTWWDELMSIALDNRLTDAKMAANIASRVAIADAWEDGKTSGEARDDALEAIAEYFDTPVVTGSSTIAAALIDTGYAAAVAREDDDIDDRFIAHTITDDEYGGDGSIVEDGTYIDGEHATHEIPLPSGDTREIPAPEIHHEWDDGDTLSVGLEEVIDGYDDDAEEIHLETDDGHAAEFRGRINVQSVGDPDDDGLPSEAPLWLWEFGEFVHDVNEVVSEMQANYDLELVDTIYDALDDGTLDPSDVRGVEGQAEHLSGSTDATESRYQMALLNTLGLDRQELADVASMTVEYDGFTDRSIDRDDDGEIETIELTEHVEGETFEGQLFAELVGDSALSPGTDYLITPRLFIGDQSNDQILAVHPVTHRVYWEADLPDTPHNPVVTPEGDKIIVPADGDVHAIDAADGSIAWTYDQFDDDVENILALSPDGETVYGQAGSPSISDGVHAISVEDGEQEWVHSRSYDGYPSGLAILPDGTIVGGDSEEEVFGIDPDGDERWQFDTPDLNWTGFFGLRDGETFIGYAGDGEIVAYDAESQEEEWEYTDISTSPANDVDQSPDGETIFAGGSDDAVHAIDRETGDQIWTDDLPHRLQAVQHHPTKDLLFVSHFDGDVLVYDPDTGDELDQLPVPDGTPSQPGLGMRFGENVFDRAMFFDAPEGEEVTLPLGKLTVTEMTDADGNVLEDDYEADWSRPQHDEPDMEEYATYVEHVTEKHVEVIDEEDDDIDVAWPGIGDYFDDMDIPGMPVLIGAAAVLYALTRD